MKRAILVLGAECSGTRYWTDLLIRAGCAGSAEHIQPWDSTSPEHEELIVWRRSFPHGGQWPGIPQLAHLLRQRHYEVSGLVCLRGFFSICSGQAGKHQPTFQEAEQAVQFAYKLIFTGITVANLPYWIANYEAAALRPEAYCQRLLKRLGLNTVPAQFVDGNEKYYEQPSL